MHLVIMGGIFVAISALLARGELFGESLLELLSRKTAKRIECESFKNRSRTQPKHFTRKRSMSFGDLMRFLLTPRKCSTNTALRRFFRQIGSAATMKQQSLSEARMKVRVEALRELFLITPDSMIERCQKKWHGYRVFAIDGTTAQLPCEKVLADYFGALGKDKSAPAARASILYDVLNDIIVDAYMEPLAIDERTLAEWHINHYSMNPESLSRNLFIYDRGYPSFQLIERHIDDEHHFVMRVKKKQFPAVDALEIPAGCVEIQKDGRSMCVRVLRFMLDSGEQETLITNIFDERLGVKDFKVLYFLRWPIETKYDIVKNKLALEHFTARSPEGVIQDFYATMYLANIAEAAIFDATPAIDQSRNNKGNKHIQRANINEAIGILKDDLIHALHLDDDDLRHDMLMAIFAKIASYTTPVRTIRSFPRNTPRMASFHHYRRRYC